MFENLLTINHNFIRYRDWKLIPRFWNNAHLIHKSSIDVVELLSSSLLLFSGLEARNFAFFLRRNNRKGWKFSSHSNFKCQLKTFPLFSQIMLKAFSLYFHFNFKFVSLILSKTIVENVKGGNLKVFLLFCEKKFLFVNAFKNIYIMNCFYWTN